MIENRPNGLYRLSNDNEAGLDQSLLLDTLNSTIDNNNEFSTNNSKLLQTEMRRPTNNSTQTLRVYSKENSAYANFLNTEKQIVRIHEDGIKQAVENMEEIIADDHSNGEADSYYTGRKRQSSGSLSSTKKGGATLKQLQEARRAKRERMEEDSKVSVVDRERKRHDEEQQLQIQQQQKDLIDKGVSKYIDQLRMQIRTGTLPKDPSVFGASVEYDHLNANLSNHQRKDSLLQGMAGPNLQLQIRKEDRRSSEQVVNLNERSNSNKNRLYQNRNTATNQQNSGYIEQLRVNGNQSNLNHGNQSTESLITEQNIVGGAEQQLSTEETNEIIVDSQVSPRYEDTGIIMRNTMQKISTNQFSNDINLSPGVSPHYQPYKTANRRESVRDQPFLPSRKPLFDSVKTHNEKVNRVHKQFSKLGQGSANSLANNSKIIQNHKNKTSYGNQRKNFGKNQEQKKNTIDGPTQDQRKQLSEIQSDISIHTDNSRDQHSPNQLSPEELAQKRKQKAIISGKQKLRIIHENGQLLNLLAKMIHEQQKLNKNPDLISKLKLEQQQEKKQKKKGFGIGIIKLQKAVRSKKFDLIKHFLKQFTRIREAEMNGGTEESKQSPGLPNKSKQVVGKISQDSESLSSDNYDQPEDLAQQVSEEQQFKSMINLTGRVAMSSQQIIAEKTMRLNPAEEKKRLQKQLFNNQELRTFFNQHEKMIHQTFDKIFLDLVGPQNAEALLKQPLKDSTENIQFEQMLRKDNQNTARKAEKKKHQETVQQIKSLVNVKELYMKWLLELYNIEESEDKIFMRKYGHEKVHENHEGSDELAQKLNILKRPTLLQKEIAKELKKNLQELRDKELIKAYLFKRLGHMAHESGAIKRIHQNYDEQMNLNKKQEKGQLSEIGSDEELPVSPGLEEIKEATGPGNSKIKDNWSQYQYHGRLAQYKTQNKLPSQDLKRIQAYYAGTRFEVGKMPQVEKDGKLSVLTLAVQAQFSPARTYNNNSTQNLPAAWRTTLTKISPTREPAQIETNEQLQTLSDRCKTKLLASHYGKWYLDPKDFNQSMNEHKKKLLKNSIIKQEIDAEIIAQEKAQACFRNKSLSPVQQQL